MRKKALELRHSYHASKKFPGFALRSSTGHNIATSKMAAAFEVGRVVQDSRGRFCGKHKFKQRNNVSASMKEMWSVGEKENSEVLVNDTGFMDAFQLSGRRVVDLGVLAEALDGGYSACNTPLKLSNCTDDTLSGLGSFLYIVCCNSECGEINVCRTHQTHRVANEVRGPDPFLMSTLNSRQVSFFSWLLCSQILAFLTLENLIYRNIFDNFQECYTQESGLLT